MVIYNRSQKDKQCQLLNNTNNDVYSHTISLCQIVLK